MLRMLLKIREWLSDKLNKERDTTRWEPDTPFTLDDFSNFMKYNTMWKIDEVHGLLDNIQSIGYMNWQLLNNGCIAGDCDDLATYACYMLSRMGYVTYRVNLVEHLHVICIYTSDGSYSWCSNSKCNKTCYTSMYEAIKGYCNLYGNNRLSKDKRYVGKYIAEAL